MKSFVKKVAALAVVFSMASSTLANAQEEDGKVSFSVQGDLVSPIFGVVSTKLVLASSRHYHWG